MDRPHRLRLTVGGMLVLMIPLAVGSAALSNPTATWAALVFYATLILLFSAIMGVVYRRGAARAFWLGFALFGWGYWLLCDSGLFGMDPLQRFGSYPWNNREGDPVRALTKGLVDGLPFDRHLAPRAVGDKVQVTWPK